MNICWCYWVLVFVIYNVIVVVVFRCGRSVFIKWDCDINFNIVVIVIFIEVVISGDFSNKFNIFVDVLVFINIDVIKCS